MNYKFISLMLIISFLLGIIIGSAVKYTWENTMFQPYLWEGDKGPIIVNCYGQDFSELQIIRAIHYWTVLGHNISYYEHTPPESICKKEYIDGFIILKKGERFQMDSKILASTRRFTMFNTIKSAVITYRPGAQNLMWINEHELGHALGYAHCEQAGHIMHPLYYKMSGKFWIP